MELPTNRPDYSKYTTDPDTGEEIQIHDSRGAEMPDPVPMAPPLGYTKPLSMFDQMRAQIRAEHSRLRQLELEELRETPDQANDFDVDDDIENMPSLYEEKFDPVDFEVRNRLRQAEHRANVEKAVEKLPDQAKELLNGDNLKPDERRETRAGAKPAERSKGSKFGSDKGAQSSVRGDIQRGDKDSVGRSGESPSGELDD